MSLRTLKKTTKPLPCDEATNTTRPMKSFFSFTRASSKRASSRSDLGHECNEKSNGVQFPGSSGIQRSQMGLGLTPDSPPQLQIPGRSVRSSILFSQQFDLDTLRSADQPHHRDPSPAPILSNVPRPTRPTTRPPSRLMMRDESYAPPAKAQLRSDSYLAVHSSGSESSYHRPGSYNRSESRAKDSADVILPDRNRSPNATRMQQPQEQPVNLSGVLAGYQVQPTPSNLARSASPIKPRQASVHSSLSSQTPAYKSTHSTPTSTLPSSSVNSTYSPLAAFLGHSKSTTPQVSPGPTIPSSTTSCDPKPHGDLLSTFLGGQARPLDENHESHPTEKSFPVPTLTPSSSEVSPVYESAAPELALSKVMMEPFPVPIQTPPSSEVSSAYQNATSEHALSQVVMKPLPVSILTPPSSEVSLVPRDATPRQALSKLMIEALEMCDEEPPELPPNSQAHVEESCLLVSSEQDVVPQETSLEAQPGFDSPSSSKSSSRSSSALAKSDEQISTHDAPIGACGSSTPEVPVARQPKAQAPAPSAIPILSTRLSRVSSSSIKPIIAASSSSPRVTSTSGIKANQDQIKVQSKLETFAPEVTSSSVPSRSVPSNSPSVRSIKTSSSSHPTASVLSQRHQINRCRSFASESGKELDDTSGRRAGSFERRESRKRGVEKVYLDSSSPDSSSCSEKFSSVDSLDGGGAGKRTTGSDLSAELTDPSSAGSHPGSPSKENLDVDHEQKEEGQTNESEELEESEQEIKDAQESEPVESADDGQRSIEGHHKIRFEEFLLSDHRIFQRIINRLDYLDFLSLSQITEEFRDELERDRRLREIILKRYLGPFGYRTPSSKGRHPESRRMMDSMTIGLTDLMNFYAGLEFESLELIEFSKRAINQKLGLDYQTAKIIRSSTRAHNKLVAYIRFIEDLDPSPSSLPRPNYRYAGQWVEPVYRSGKAPVFKVWVPCVDHWMSDEELAECERELWRSQVWSHLKRGDVCWNLAIGDFGNEGKLLYDGRFLRDLLFEFDEVGHLPSWLNMLEFSPSYFHKVISSSTAAPIFYLDITSFGDEIKRSLKLGEDKVEVASPQARYRVKRWVYRAVIRIPQGHWAGYVIIEVEGTSEQAQELLKRCNSSPEDSGARKLTPWRIMRERSRPGKLWIRPVYKTERIA